MKIHYIRCSTVLQNSDRQKVESKFYDRVFEDRISGSVEFFARPYGSKIKKLVDKGLVTELSTHNLDRLGRSSRDLLNTIHYLTEKKVNVHITAHGLKTLDDDGKENPVAKLLLSILSCIAEMERTFILERIREGVALAKLRGAYKGRVKGKESVLKFLSKPKNKSCLQYLQKGYTNTEAAKLSGVHLNTVTKVKRLGMPNIDKP
jgi:DNA invertase Pin-like site-specific DNA recombinase